MDKTKGTLFYLDRIKLYETTKPYFLCVPPSLLQNIAQNNQVHIPVDVSISNLRGHEDTFSLDSNGFEVAKHLIGSRYTHEKLQSNRDLITDYLIEIEQFLMSRLRAKKVMIFDHELRKRNPEFPNGLGERSNLEQPVRGVHIDSSSAGAFQRAQHLCRFDKSLLEGRVQIINTWRPLIEPLHDWPLALCDAKSVDAEKDLIPSDTVFPDSCDETFQVFQNPSHKWYFLGSQRMDEVLLFKIFDSTSEERIAKWCPHASFDLATHAGIKDLPICRPRESIEVRAMVFYDA